MRRIDTFLVIYHRLFKCCVKRNRFLPLLTCLSLPAATQAVKFMYFILLSRGCLQPQWKDFKSWGQILICAYSSHICASKNMMKDQASQLNLVCFPGGGSHCKNLNNFLKNVVRDTKEATVWIPSRIQEPPHLILTVYFSVLIGKKSGPFTAEGCVPKITSLDSIARSKQLRRQH